MRGVRGAHHRLYHHHFHLNHRHQYPDCHPGAVIYEIQRGWLPTNHSLTLQCVAIRHWQNIIRLMLVCLFSTSRPRNNIGMRRQWKWTLEINQFCSQKDEPIYTFRQLGIHLCESKYCTEGTEWKYLQAFRPWLTMFAKYSESMHTNLFTICNKS